MRRIIIAIALIVLPVAGVACGGAKSPAACDARSATTTIDIQNNAFAPACVGAKAGAMLSIVNHDDTPHTFTVKNTSLNVKIDAGATASAALTGIAPGTYAVICAYHPQMTATLQVGSS